MPPDTPAVPPEALLIRRARLAAGLKVHEAAVRAGMSPTRWTQIETGHETRRGKQAPAFAPDGRLAAMARVVGVTPQELAEAGRKDAAGVLDEMLRRERAQNDEPVFPGDPELERIRRQVESDPEAAISRLADGLARILAGGGSEAIAKLTRDLEEIAGHGDNGEGRRAARLSPRSIRRSHLDVHKVLSPR